LPPLPPRYLFDSCRTKCFKILKLII
jgi:hypothetical protein